MNVNCWRDGEKTRCGYRRPRRESVVHDEMEGGGWSVLRLRKDSVGHGEEILDFILRAVRIYWRSLRRGVPCSY